MTGNSQNGPTVHFSHEISRMHSKLCNFLTKLLQSLYNKKYCTFSRLFWSPAGFRREARCARICEICCLTVDENLYRCKYKALENIQMTSRETLKKFYSR